MSTPFACRSPILGSVSQKNNRKLLFVRCLICRKNDLIFVNYAHGMKRSTLFVFKFQISKNE